MMVESSVWFTGQYEVATPFFERTVGILENVYGPRHPEVATDLIQRRVELWNIVALSCH